MLAVVTTYFTVSMPLIGYLSSEAFEEGGSRLHAFRQGLSETGYVEGRNVAIESLGGGAK